MFRLIEVVKQNDKESQAWYPFETRTVITVYITNNQGGVLSVLKLQ